MILRLLLLLATCLALPTVGAAPARAEARRQRAIVAADGGAAALAAVVAADAGAGAGVALPALAERLGPPAGYAVAGPAAGGRWVVSARLWLRGQRLLC